jgi:hypothetical protein
MSAWRTNRSFAQGVRSVARRDRAIAAVSWLAVLAWISAIIADVFDWCSLFVALRTFKGSTRRALI